jgi:hypothetical protein
MGAHSRKTLPIKISQKLISELPKDQQQDIKEFLVAKAGGKCFLCAEALNEAADQIVADHDQPAAENGDTSRDNLNLVHQACNAAKRSSPSVDVRPYLHLSAFLRKNGPLLSYGKLLPHFGIEPKPAVLNQNQGIAGFQLPNGEVVETPIYSETNGRRTYHYVFLEVPRSALFNDEKCQPRSVKLAHVWSIYSDLARNPLHEAPGCRIEQTPGSNEISILMFDGQHKTVASWMHGREKILVKIYLDLSAEQAIELVNSIQSKIKKLPLSPFELAAKMGDEWSNKLAEYEAFKGGPEHVSEDGFINWLPTPERTRAKQAFKSALVTDILTDEGLTFRSLIGRKTPPSITENAFKSKVLEQLLYLDPLKEMGQAGEALRAQERSNILRVLNMWVQYGFEIDAVGELSPQQEERRRRLTYQGSLAYVATIIKTFFQNVVYGSAGTAFLKSNPSEQQWTVIAEGIKRIMDHPVWTAELSSTKKFRAVYEALTKNQNVTAAFEAVHLDGSYISGMRELKASDWQD